MGVRRPLEAQRLAAKLLRRGVQALFQGVDPATAGCRRKGLQILQRAQGLVEGKIRVALDQVAGQGFEAGDPLRRLPGGRGEPAGALTLRCPSHGHAEQPGGGGDEDGKQ